MQSLVTKTTVVLFSVIVLVIISACQKPIKEADGIPVSPSEPPSSVSNEGKNGSSSFSQDPPPRASNPIEVPLDNGDYHITEPPIQSEEHDTVYVPEGEPPPAEPLQDPADPKEQEANVSSNPKPQQEEFDRTNLTLLGIALGDKRDQTAKKLGKPADEYKMDDETGPVTVYEYSGYSVGFDSRSRVLFVEVSSNRAATGLNGLRIGHTDEEAMKLLGKPDSSTSYVLSYTAGNSLLKLDLDPTTRTIQSIKLFGTE